MIIPLIQPKPRGALQYINILTFDINIQVICELLSTSNGSLLGDHSNDFIASAKDRSWIEMLQFRRIPLLRCRFEDVVPR